MELKFKFDGIVKMNGNVFRNSSSYYCLGKILLMLPIRLQSHSAFSPEFPLMITDGFAQPPHQKHTAFPPTLPPEYFKPRTFDAALQVTLSLMLSYPLGQ